MNTPAATLRFALPSILTVVLSAPVLAQPPAPIARADLSGTIGWQFVNRESAPYSGIDWQDSLIVAATGGWYWTDHLKSELEFGVSKEARANRYRQIVIHGRPTTEFIESRFSRRALSLSQQYQFFRNAWFHPHVAAGLNVSFDRITNYTHPVLVYDGLGPGGRVVQPERTDGPRTDTDVSPFVATGFKAYLTQRAFFRSDLRVSFRGRVNDAMARFGFGVDF